MLYPLCKAIHLQLFENAYALNTYETSLNSPTQIDKASVILTASTASLSHLPLITLILVLLLLH